MRRIAMMVAFLALAGGSLMSAEEPVKPSPEMRVLEDLIGTWDEEVVHGVSEWVPKAMTVKSVTKKTWSLGGKFIRMEGTWQPQKTEFLCLTGYDAHAKVYRTYYFDAEAAMPRGSLKGTWDDNTRTMTWKGADEDGNTSVCTEKFIDKNTVEWTLTVKNTEGKLMLDMAAKCKRQKP